MLLKADINYVTILGQKLWHSTGTVWAEVIDDVESDTLQPLISKKGYIPFDYLIRALKKHIPALVNEDMSIVFSCLPLPSESMYGDTIKEMKMIICG